MTDNRINYIAEPARRLIEKIAGAVTTLSRETVTAEQQGEAVAQDCIPHFKALGMYPGEYGWEFDEDSFERDHMPSPDTHAAEVELVEGAANDEEAIACLIWAQMCPGIVMGDDDLPYYLNAAKAALSELADHSAPTPQPAVAETVEFTDEQLRPFIHQAALTWCGRKGRETFIDDERYFKRNWAALPGLRAVVVEEAGKWLAAIRQTALLGTREAK